MSDAQQQERPERDWSEPRPASAPAPTYAPAALALGITLFGWGLLVSAVLSLVGLVLMILAMASWIRSWMDDV